MRRRCDRLYDWGGQGLLALSPAALFQRLYGLSWYGGMLEAWIDSLDLPAGARVLEVGCGPGMLCRHMGQRGLQVTGVDRSHRMLAAARRIAPNAMLRQTLLPHLPFGDGAFDGVVAASVLNLISDRTAALAEMVRVVRGGGILSVLFPLPGFKAVRAPPEVARGGEFSRAAFRMWSRRAPVLEAAACEASLVACGVALAHRSSYLGNAIGVVTAQVPAT